MRSVVLGIKPEQDNREKRNAANKVPGMWKRHFDASCVMPELRTSFGEVGR
jgi:hypothetical protein